MPTASVTVDQHDWIDNNDFISLRSDNVLLNNIIVFRSIDDIDTTTVIVDDSAHESVTIVNDDKAMKLQISEQQLISIDVDTREHNEINTTSITRPYISIKFSPDAMKFISTSAPKNRHKYTKIGERKSMCFKMIRSESQLVKTLLHSYGLQQVRVSITVCLSFT
jgi:hypothetical protein